MKPLISVIITTYKRSDKVEYAIQSVLNQTYKNIELIVIDDNANDLQERIKTESIVKKYKNVIYIQNISNLGGSLSRNVGIDNSKGEFVAFLDDDDKYEQTKIEKQYDCYLSHINDNTGLIYCYCYRENALGKLIGEYSNDYEGNVIYEQMKCCIAGTSLWFCPKDVIIKVGKFEDTPCKQDSILLLKILGAGYNIYRVPEKLVYYYEHGGTGISGTKLKNIEGLNNYYNWCKKFYEYISDKEINDIEYIFSKQLITLYIINNLKKQAFKHLYKMILLKPFKKETFVAVFKCLFSNYYVKHLINKR